jgi:anti-sigma28 factor (negative regulator of flagellin synthesis)
MNHAKIQAISDAIANGTYRINSERVASKLFERETALFG